MRAEERDNYMMYSRKHTGPADDNHLSSRTRKRHVSSEIAKSPVQCDHDL